MSSIQSSVSSRGILINEPSLSNLLFPQKKINSDKSALRAPLKESLNLLTDGLNKNFTIDKSEKSKCKNENKINRTSYIKNKITIYQNILSNYSFLLKCAEATFLAVKNFDLTQFDALVKENCCQIRAVKIAIIAQDYKITDLAEKKIKIKQQIGEEIENLLLNAQTEKKMRKFRSNEFQAGENNQTNGSENFFNTLIQAEDIQEEIKNFLKSSNLNAPLSTDDFFLLSAYILTQVKKDLLKTPYANSKQINNEKQSHKKNDRSDTKMLTENVFKQLNIHSTRKASISFLRNLEKTLLRSLSEQCVNYLIECAHESHSEEIKTYISEKYIAWKIEDKGINNYICSLPMFWSYDLLLEETKKKRLPLILKIQKIPTEEITCLFFKINLKLNDYINTEPDNEDRKEPALIIEGKTSGTIENIKKYSPIDIILANAAVHKQYVDRANDKKYLLFDVAEWISKNEKDEEVSLDNFPKNRWGEYIKKGFNLGCSKKNISLFFIQHVYCTTVDKQLPLLIQQVPV